MTGIKINETEWNLKDLLRSDNDPAQNKKSKIYEKKNMDFVKKWKGRDGYLKDPKVLKETLDELGHLIGAYSLGGDVGYYFFLRSHQNKSDPTIKAKLSTINDLSTKIENELEFFTNRLAKVPKDKQKEFLKSPDLLPYKHFLEMLFLEAKYLLSENEEKIMNLLEPTSVYNWVKMTSDFLTREEREVVNEKGKKVKKSFSEIRSLTGDKNKKVRDSAAEAFSDIIKKQSDVAEAEINSILKSKKINDELRKINRPDLGRHIADDIDSKAVDSLLDAVESRFDISKRYYKLKAQLMGCKKLKYHERNVEYGVFTKKFSYEETVDLVAKALKKLNGEFFEIFKNMVENGRIDVYPRKNKDDSEFCVSTFKDGPTYIMLNHAGQLSDVVTFAHEIGHAINDGLTKKSQNALNMFVPVSMAEVASTFIQDFSLDEVSKGVSDEEKLTLNMRRLNDSVSSVMRQVACYRFEQSLHKAFRENGYLSKKQIGEIFLKHMKAYMGSYVEQSKGAENWWVPWSHIREFFYVYSYASGELIAKSMQRSVRENHEFVAKIKDFLKAGSSESPKNTFLKLGIDIDNKNFWLKGLEEVDALLKDTQRLAKKLGKV